MELADGFHSNMIVNALVRQECGPMAGPTCDSIDVFGEHRLPTNMEVEDVVFITN